MFEVWDRVLITEDHDGADVGGSTGTVIATRIMGDDAFGVKVDKWENIEKGHGCGRYDMGMCYGCWWIPGEKLKHLESSEFEKGLREYIRKELYNARI